VGKRGPLPQRGLSELRRGQNPKTWFAPTAKGATSERCFRQLPLGTGLRRALVVLGWGCRRRCLLRARSLPCARRGHASALPLVLAVLARARLCSPAAPCRSPPVRGCGWRPARAKYNRALMAKRYNPRTPGVTVQTSALRRCPKVRELRGSLLYSPAPVADSTRLGSRRPGAEAFHKVI
jgi:hypothetical protein